ncbi:MAG TPA: accessory gene regulator B family protein [Lachnospiraceae bacterium]|nr:accessory gene regulator B family protein [Lachnospiraceae bacterium]
MEKIAVFLTEYVEKKGMITKDEYSIYVYGFQVTLEIILCIFISSIIAGLFDMLIEEILFFVIFIPLRSYAGGLHLKNYWSCLLLSCLTFSVVLFMCKTSYIESSISFVALIVLILSVWVMYPVENGNRSVDKEENDYFRKRLKKYLLIDVLIALICLVINNEQYLLLCTITFFMVAVTMLIGKFKSTVYSKK